MNEVLNQQPGPQLLLSLRAKLKYLSKISVGAVSYLNTKPLIYGLRNHPVYDEIILIEDYPSRVAQMLLDGTIDVGLIPVAATLKMSQWHIVGTHCIGASGPVASVCLFSELPIENIETVFLDYQSRTSVNLARILLREYWKKDVRFIDAKGEDFRGKITGTAAGVVIGDRALEQRAHSPYIYDLAEAWIDHTGLPFVFAAWIAARPLPEQFCRAFDEANALGLRQLDTVIAAHPYPAYDLHKYYTGNIDYLLDDDKKKGLHLFLEKLKKEMPNLEK